MATFYIDPSSLTDGVGSELDPFNTWSSATLATGNTYLQKRGTTENIWPPAATGQSITVGPYSTGDLPILQSYTTITSGWSEVSTNIWVWTDSVDKLSVILGFTAIRSTKPRRQYYNRGDSGVDTTKFTEFGQWDTRNGSFSSNLGVLAVYSDVDPAIKWGTIYRGTYSEGPIDSTNATTFDISNFKFSNSGSGITITRSSAGTTTANITSVETDYCYRGIMEISGATAATIITGLITTSTVTNSYREGIGLEGFVYSDVTSNTVTRSSFVESTAAIYGVALVGDSLAYGSISLNTVSDVGYGQYWENDGDGIFFDVSDGSYFNVHDNNVSDLTEGNSGALRNNSAGGPSVWSDNIVDNVQRFIGVTDSEDIGTGNQTYTDNIGTNILHTGIFANQFMTAGTYTFTGNTATGAPGTLAIDDRSTATVSINSTNIFTNFVSGNSASSILGNNDQSVQTQLAAQATRAYAAYGTTDDNIYRIPPNSTITLSSMTTIVANTHSVEKDLFFGVYEAEQQSGVWRPIGNNLIDAATLTITYDGGGFFLYTDTVGQTIDGPKVVIATFENPDAVDNIAVRGSVPGDTGSTTQLGGMADPWGSITGLDADFHYWYDYTEEQTVANEITFFTGNTTPGSGNSAIYQTARLKDFQRDLDSGWSEQNPTNGTFVYATDGRSVTITTTQGNARPYLNASMSAQGAGEFYIVCGRVTGLSASTAIHNMNVSGGVTSGQDIVSFTSDGWWYFAYESDGGALALRYGFGVAAGEATGVSATFELPMVVEVASLTTPPLGWMPPVSTGGYRYASANTLGTEGGANSGIITEVQGAALAPIGDFISAAWSCDTFGMDTSSDIAGGTAALRNGASYGMNSVSARTLATAAATFDDVCKYTGQDADILRPQFLVIQGGLKDLDAGVAAATVLASMEAMVAIGRANGFSEMILIDVQPSVNLSGADNTQRAAYNVLLEAYASNNNFGLVQFSESVTNGGLATNGSPDILNGTYTSDGENLITAGTAAAGAAISAIMDTLPLANPPLLTSEFLDIYNDNTDVVSTDLSGNVTGETSMSAQGLPPGLAMDAAGVITGTITANGDYTVTVNARNNLGILAPPGIFHWYVGPQARVFQQKMGQIGPNGDWYTFNEPALTIAAMNAAFFSNQYAASILKTDDFLTVIGSDGAKIYQVTVTPASRTVALTLSLSFA